MSLATHPGWTRDGEVQRLRLLYQLLSALTRARSLEDVYEAAITCLLTATSADRAAVLMFDDDGVMRFEAWRNLSEEYRQAVTGHTPWVKGCRDARPLAIPDVNLDSGLRSFRELFASEGIRALVFIPLAMQSGVFGKFMLYYSEPHECDEDELAIAEAIASHVSIASERKRAELALARSEQRLQAILDHSATMIFLKDVAGKYVLINQQFEAVFHIAQAGIAGKTDYDVFPPDVADRFRENDRKALSAGTPIAIEEQAPHDDGVHTYISVKFPLKDSEGIATGVCGIATDITARKQAEEERLSLLKREQDARSTAEMLNQIGPKLLAELDLNKLAQVVTDTASQLVGAEFGVFFQNSLNDAGESSMLYALSGIDRKVFDQLLVRNADRFGAAFRGECVVRCDDATRDKGAGRSLRSYLAIPVVLRSGEVVGGLFFGHALPGRFTESHEAIGIGIAAQAAIAIDNARLFEQAQWVQAELKRSNEELRRANRDLETFAYSASHDLQEPLRNIAIAAQLLARNCGAQLVPRDSQLLSDILNGVNRMNALVQDLLTYTKATKYAEGAPPAVQAAHVLTGVLDSLKAPIESAGARVTCGQLPAVRMHEGRLAQLLQNLVSNAVKYRNKVDPYVHIAAEERDGWIVFSVADNGIGIEPQYADEIFGLFKRLHRREDYPGSGIGLAICQRIVEQYGGRIWLDKSEPGEGSTFCFAIPAR